ncbi:ATP-binding protein [Aspergillus ibericus CBS 121593]|uniref:AAA-domain-containing protein n=1 Tax=Aspergillus ibericus CBS 121593 TaxID=1448316 RepID=A0A395HD73_9EURO|nr:AAA-domain-containing protein [Aspergillus ibericus CBS 121593]RAL05449.1 AAA-domain-containing protein [Aspergillus ibericus CBS 121593]
MSPTPSTMHDESKALHCKHEYHLPDWFVAGNVKVKTDDRTGIRLLRNSSPLRRKDRCSKHVDNGGRICEAKDKQSEVVDQFEFQEDQYAELHDLAAAALFSKALLPGKKECDVGPFVAVEAGNFTYTDAIIAHLARDIGASYISVGAEELYNLARDFHQQDHPAQRFEGCSIKVAPVCKDATKQPISLVEILREDEPDGSNKPCDSDDSDDSDKNFDEPGDHNSDTAYAILEDRDCMIRYQFAASQCSRTQCSIKAIIDAHRAKAVQQPPSPHNPHKVISTQVSPVILHLREPGEISDISKEVIKNFKNAVLDRWNKNEHVLLVASENHYAIESGLDIDSSLKVRFKMSPEQKVACRTERAHLQASRRIRKLKKATRHRLPRGFASELLSDATLMDIPDHLVTTALEPYGNYDRIANQILGRACMKGTLEPSDMHEILMRANDKKRKAEEPPKDELLEANELSVSEKLARIRDKCTEYELGLCEFVVDSEAQNVTYDDVILAQSVKDHMRHLVHMSKIRFEGSSTILLENTRVTGALLYGPPGTGKTHLARAVANDSKATMLSISPAGIMSKWVGETEKAIHAAFTLAEKLAPCILFIDEVDSMFYRRSSDDRQWERKALNQFLQEMDGLSTGKDTPFVLCATNRPIDLDEAFLRRLPKHVVFGLPGEEERLKILQIFLKEPDLDPQVSLRDLARKTEGLSGSDLRALCAEAALHFAVDEGLSRTNDETGTPVKLQLKPRHFTEALRNIHPSVSNRSQEDTKAFNTLFNRDTTKNPRNDEDGSDLETAFL